MAFIRFPARKVTWSIEPETFASSNLVERGICKACGTPLTYKSIDGPNISLTLNSLDDPTAAPSPQVSLATERKASWLSNLDGIRRDEFDLTGTPNFSSNQNA